MADMLLDVDCLRRDGFQTAYEGARVVVERRGARMPGRRSASCRWTTRPRSIRRRRGRRALMLRWRRLAG